MNHLLLLSICKFLGMGVSTVNMLHSYLSDRSQSVSVGGRMSQYLPVRRGVPQGSILGPLLFVIYRYLTLLKLRNRLKSICMRMIYSY